MLEADRDGIIHSGDLGPALLNRAGRAVYVLRPDASEFYIEDIAFHLARMRRFSSIGISVAQHSLLVEGRAASFAASPAVRIHALLHDAAEHVLGDMPAPIKKALAMIGGHATAYELIETLHMEAIGRALALPPIGKAEASLIKTYDIEVRAAEIRDLFPVAAQPAFGRMPKPWPENPITRLSEDEAERLFLRRYYKLQDLVLEAAP